MNDLLKAMLNEVEFNLARLDEVSYAESPREYMSNVARVEREVEALMKFGTNKFPRQKFFMREFLRAFKGNYNVKYLEMALEWMLVHIKQRLKMKVDPALVEWRDSLNDNAHERSYEYLRFY